MSTVPLQRPLYSFSGVMELPTAIIGTAFLVINYILLKMGKNPVYISPNNYEHYQLLVDNFDDPDKLGTLTRWRDFIAAESDGSSNRC